MKKIYVLALNDETRDMRIADGPFTSMVVAHHAMRDCLAERLVELYGLEPEAALKKVDDTWYASGENEGLDFNIAMRGAAIRYADCLEDKYQIVEYNEEN